MYKVVLMDFQDVYQYTKDLNVLYVEDDIDLLEETKDALDDFFYNVDTALHGKEALIKYIEKKSSGQYYDIVITDLNMPIMDGMTLIKELHLINKHQPIIVVSAYNESSRLIDLIQSGIDNFIMKPIVPQQLMSILMKSCKIIVEHKELTTYRKRLENSNQSLLSTVTQQAKEILYTQQVSIETIANMVESYDDETGTHVKRIENYTTVMINRLAKIEEFDEEFIQAVPFASILHDIGKLMVPKDILTKPEKLTTEEFTIIKTHAALGGEVLKKANLTFRKNFNKDSYLKIASDIAMYHHEKWDGSGYPEGLAGCEIPIAARIVSIADVYDALRSKRVYKDGLTHEETMKIIVKERGKSFDPKLINIFVGVHDEFRKIFDELS